MHMHFICGPVNYAGTWHKHLRIHRASIKEKAEDKDLVGVQKEFFGIL